MNTDTEDQDYEMVEIQADSIAQRDCVAAQWHFEASMKHFDAAALSQNTQSMQVCMEDCREKLDSLLAAKERMYREMAGESTSHS